MPLSGCFVSISLINEGTDDALHDDDSGSWKSERRVRPLSVA